MAEDVVRLLEHLSVETAVLMGYSMGGAITMQLLAEHADRFNAVVVAGSEDDLVDDPENAADSFPGAEAVAVAGTDHLTTVGQPAYKDAALFFLEREGL